MLLAPRPTSTAGHLLRLLAVWLAVILLFEGLAVAHSRGAGPLHQHRQQQQRSVPPPVLFVHGPAQTHAHDRLQHGSQHGVHDHSHHGAERHHHASGDNSVVAQADAALDDVLDAAAAALAAALASLACAWLLRIAGAAGRVWRPAPAWAWLTAQMAPALKPPRLP